VEQLGVQCLAQGHFDIQLWGERGSDRLRDDPSPHEPQPTRAFYRKRRKVYLLIGDGVKHLFHLFWFIDVHRHSVGGVQCIVVQRSEANRQEQITLQTKDRLYCRGPRQSPPLYLLQLIRGGCVNVQRPAGGRPCAATCTACTWQSLR